MREVWFVGNFNELLWLKITDWVNSFCKMAKGASLSIFMRRMEKKHHCYNTVFFLSCCVAHLMVCKNRVLRQKKTLPGRIFIFMSHLWSFWLPLCLSVAGLTLHHWPDQRPHTGPGCRGQLRFVVYTLCETPCYKQLIFRCRGSHLCISLSLYAKKYLVFCYFCVFTVYHDQVKTKDSKLLMTLTPTLFCLLAQRLASGRQTLPLQPG